MPMPISLQIAAAVATIVSATLAVLEAASAAKRRIRQRKNKR